MGNTTPCALTFHATEGLHKWAAGWVRREHRGEVAGINSSVCSQKNADRLNTAGRCLAEREQQVAGLVEVVTGVTALT